MTGSSRPSSAAWVRSTEYFSSASYVDSASWLVTRRLPRTAVRPSRSPASVRPASVQHLLGRALGRRRARSAGARWRRSRPSCAAARSSAPASTRVSAAEARGLLDGRAGGPRQRVHARPRPARCRARGVDAGLGDQAARRCRPPARSSATSRWIGSVAVLPAVVADELGGLDRLAAAGGELLGAELAHLRSPRPLETSGSGSRRAGSARLAPAQRWRRQTTMDWPGAGWRSDRAACWPGRRYAARPAAWRSASRVASSSATSSSLRAARAADAVLAARGSGVPPRCRCRPR